MHALAQAARANLRAAEQVAVLELDLCELLAACRRFLAGWCFGRGNSASAAAANVATEAAQWQQRRR